MPPNKKKKKPASNPARGFATVSVPSRPKATDSPIISSAADSVVVSEDERPTGSSNDPRGGPGKTGADLQNYSPEELEKHLEEAELQSIVEKYASKCKNDASRQAARLETERRLLRPQSSLLNLSEWLPQELLDRILKLAREEENENENMTSQPVSSRTKTVPLEEETISRLWTLRDTLLRLNFPAEKIVEVLRHILNPYTAASSIGLKEMTGVVDEALEWLSLHCSSGELPGYEGGSKASISKSADTMITTIDEDLPSSSKAPSSEEAKSRTGKADYNQSSPATPISSPEDSDGSVDVDQLIPSWLKLRSRLYQINPEYFNRSKKSKKGGKPENQGQDQGRRAERLQRKLLKIEKDVLFDKLEAESQWRDVLDQLRKESVFQQEKERVKKPITAETRPKEVIDVDSEQPKDTPSGDSDDNVDLLGDMFSTELIVSEPTTTGESTDVYISIRDFGQPAGLHPRRVLEELCKARDPGFKITFKSKPSASFSNRITVEIQWSKPQDIPSSLSIEGVSHRSAPFGLLASMDTIATPTSQQAEGFISTYVLFLLSTANTKESKSYLRLPAVWRDLWSELSESRKEQEDTADRDTVKGLRSLVQESSGGKDDDVVLSDNFRRRNGTPNPAEAASKPLPREDFFQGSELAKLWLDKSSTRAYREMLTAREKLPVWKHKREILDCLSEHQAIIICSETGSGKSTQIPSFVLENELSSGRDCKIYVTEPRRISAISLARRVSEELGENKNDVGTTRSLIGYAIRLESKLSRSSRLVYATTGVVVRMLESPENFKDITHVVLDEVHERTIDSDFLLIILRRLMTERPELRLILMSATVDAQRFSSYLGGAPIMNIPGRTFPVEVKYIEDAVELTQYHPDEKELPDAYENEDDDLLSDEGGGTEKVKDIRSSLGPYSKQTKDTVMKLDEYRLDYKLIVRLLTYIATDLHLQKYSKAILVFLPGIAEIRRLNDEITGEAEFGRGWVIHTLHSSIASEDQEKAFVVPPDGMRKIVIATNIAETGITIPDITAVIDAGKEKVMRFDERRQLSRLVESFISRANAKQRRGRAGRVQKGICFHLFTKYRHDHQLAEQQTPEMLRLSLQDLVLRVKICNLGEIEETLLEAVDPPSAKNIRRAIDSLKEVKALTSAENLTSLGKQLAKLPLDVFLGKLLIYGCIFKCLDACVSIAAILSSKSPFVNTIGSNAQKDLARLAFKRGDSDLLTIYNAYCSWKRVKATPGMSEYTFCRKNFLSMQTLGNIEELKTQLVVSIVDAGLLQLDETEQTALKRARFTGRQRQFFTVPERVDLNGVNDMIVDSVIAWSFYPKLLTREGKGWRNVANNQTVSLHPTSVNKQPTTPIKWLSYYHIMQTRGKFYNAHETSAVEDIAVALLCGEPDFKLYAGVIAIDNNRIRFAVRDWKLMIAIKVLSSQIRQILADIIRNPRRSLTQKQRQWIEIWQQMFSQSRDVVGNNIHKNRR